MKNAKLIFPPKHIIVNIIPRCLRLDKAIIFFKSNLILVPIPVINIVSKEIYNNNINILLESLNLNRIKRYTPTVTKVEECAKDEAGFGPAISAGGQEEKGIWTLFVTAAKNKKKWYYS